MLHGYGVYMYVTRVVTVMEHYGISIYSGNYVRIWGTMTILSSLGEQWMSQLGDQ